MYIDIIYRHMHTNVHIYICTVLLVLDCICVLLLYSFSPQSTGNSVDEELTNGLLHTFMYTCMHLPVSFSSIPSCGGRPTLVRSTCKSSTTYMDHWLASTKHTCS